MGWGKIEGKMMWLQILCKRTNYDPLQIHISNKYKKIKKNNKDVIF